MARDSDPLSRLWQLFVTAIVLLAFLPVALALLRDLLATLLFGLWQALPPVLGSALFALVAGFFVVGLFVRVRKAFEGAERATQERYERSSARRPAQDVAVQAEGGPKPVDPDPVLPLEEES